MFNSSVEHIQDKSPSVSSSTAETSEALRIKSNLKEVSFVPQLYFLCVCVCVKVLDLCSCHIFISDILCLSMRKRGRDRYVYVCILININKKI